MAASALSTLSSSLVVNNAGRRSIADGADVAEKGKLLMWLAVLRGWIADGADWAGGAEGSNGANVA